MCQIKVVPLELATGLDIVEAAFIGVTRIPGPDVATMLLLQSEALP